MQENRPVHVGRDRDAGNASPEVLVSYTKRVTLSSAEAELGALVKAATETIGIIQMTEGLGTCDRRGVCRFERSPGGGQPKP